MSEEGKQKAKNMEEFRIREQLNIKKMECSFG